IGPPYVPAVFENGTLEDGACYVVLEFLSMPTLASRLAELSRPLTLDEFALRARTILGKLAGAHPRGFVHRASHTGQIFISDLPPAAKLVDFGIVKALPTKTVVSGQTTEGTVLGTAEYMSPEQCEGRGDIDVRTDVYAMGIVLYKMLTAKTPFSGQAAEV